MLYSKAHNFVFVKTRKTAGSSLEVLLSQHMRDPADIITPVSADEEAALRQPLGVVPRGHLGPAGDELYWHHMPARRIKEQLGQQAWRQALAISVERHPYEKAVSMAHYVQALPGQTFADHLDAVVRRARFANWRLYTNRHGNVMVDVLLRYEHLKADVDALLVRLGLPAVTELPRAKTGFRVDRRPAHEVLTAEHKRLIQQACAPEFEYFGYQA